MKINFNSDLLPEHDGGEVRIDRETRVVNRVRSSRSCLLVHLPQRKHLLHDCSFLRRFYLRYFWRLVLPDRYVLGSGARRYE